MGTRYLSPSTSTARIQLGRDRYHVPIPGLPAAGVLAEEGGHAAEGGVALGGDHAAPEGVRQRVVDDKLARHAGVDEGAVQVDGAAQEDVAPAGDAERGREVRKIAVDRRHQRVLG